MNNQQFRWCVSLAAMAVMILSVVTAEAQEISASFRDSTGYWTNAADWTNDEVPGTLTKVYIGLTPSATCILDTAGQQCARLYLGQGAGDVGQLNVTGSGGLTVNTDNDDNTFWIARYGTGILHQTSGVINAGYQNIRMGVESTGVATLNLSGGVITNMNYVKCGDKGQATINLSGGVFGPIGSGSYVGVQSDSVGTVNQSGGIWNNGGKSINIGDLQGSSGTVNLTDNAVFTNIFRLYLGNNGYGEIDLSGTGEIQMSSYAYVGYASGTGVVNQTGGTWKGAGLYPGNNEGTYGVYNITGGTLDMGGGSIQTASSRDFYSYGEINISGGIITNVSSIYSPGYASAGQGLVSINGSEASIYIAQYRGAGVNAGSGILRIKPGLGGISTIHVINNGTSNAGKAYVDGTTLEVDFSDYDSTDDLTLMTYDTALTGPFEDVKILTPGWSADVDDSTGKAVRLVNITRPPQVKGTVVLIY